MKSFILGFLLFPLLLILFYLFGKSLWYPYLLKDISGKESKPDLAEARKGEISGVFLNCEKAKKELKWVPKKSFKEGLQETFNWFNLRIREKV